MALIERDETDHTVSAILDEFRPSFSFYETTYKEIHQDPELSCQETRTASIASQHLKSLSFEVHERVGGHGVVGVLANGSGPTVLLRADMDALPVSEDTGLPYSSTKTMKDVDGKEVPVMHACGHDMHVTSLMATASLLHAARSKWMGTLIALFQPNEELAGGAQAMVDDGLYTKFGIPLPDIVLGQHVFSTLPAGVVSLGPGPMLAAVDSLEIRIYGKGGHGTRPDIAIDPILTASHIVVRLQSITSREVKPGETAVISCGSIHGGEASNIIPDYVDLKLTIRAYNPQIHDKLLESVRRVVRAECEASGVVKEPRFKTIMHAPSTINDLEKSSILSSAFKAYFKEKAWDMEALPGSEDFSVLARACNAPYLFWMYGGTEPQQWDEAKKAGKLNEIPFNHNAGFKTVVQPTMRTATDAFALAALTFLRKAA